MWSCKGKSSPREGTPGLRLSRLPILRLPQQLRLGGVLLLPKGHTPLPVTVLVVGGRLDAGRPVTSLFTSEV